MAPSGLRHRAVSGKFCAAWLNTALRLGGRGSGRQAGRQTYGLGGGAGLGTGRQSRVLVGEEAGTKWRGPKEPSDLVKKAWCGPSSSPKGLGRPRIPLPSSPRSPLPPEPSAPSCPSPPPPPNQDHLSSRSLFILRSFFFFVRNSHKNQCKTISVGVLFYITKTLDI